MLCCGSVSICSQVTFILLRSAVGKCVVLWGGASDKGETAFVGHLPNEYHGSNNTLALHQIYNRLLSVVV